MRTRDIIPFSGNHPVFRGEWSPDHWFEAMRNEMHRMFDDAWHRFDVPTRFGATGSFDFTAPRIDVVDNDKDIQVTAELPGMTEKNIDVILDGEVLTIRGERKTEDQKTSEDERYVVKERSFGRFERRLRVDAPVDEGKIKATFKDGLLTVVLPKKADGKSKAKRIALTH